MDVRLKPYLFIVSYKTLDCSSPNPHYKILIPIPCFVNNSAIWVLKELYRERCIRLKTREKAVLEDWRNYREKRGFIGKEALVSFYEV